MGRAIVNKTARRLTDIVIGVPGRWFLRNLIVHPLARLLYKIEVANIEAGLSIKNGAIIVARHLSRMDAILLVDAAWRFARVRPTAWWREYDHWAQYWVMLLTGAVRMGSDKTLPPDVRAEQTAWTKEVLSKLLKAGWGVLIFAEGGIGDGKTVVVPRNLTGIHDIVVAHPDKPVLLVQMQMPEKASFWQRQRVIVTLERVDGFSTAGGPAGVNKRLEDHFNNVPVTLAA
jgi:1-acyl-sn-glycerol-3-phosphate acyltransferase